MKIVFILFNIIIEKVRSIIEKVLQKTKGGSFYDVEKVISMLLVAAMLAMPIGCGKDGNKDKDTTSGVETTDIGDDSAETDAPPKTPVPKEDKETKESDKDTDTENETDFSDDDYEPAQVTKKNMKVCLLRI